MNKEELIALLLRYNVRLEKWGTGEAKTVDHLLREINSKEVELQEQDTYLLRYSAGAALYVFCEVGDKLLFLKEEKQVFKDGRIKVRPIEHSIGEKLTVNEDPLVGAYRALEEELKIFAKLPLESCEPIIRNTVPSISFPDLMTYYFVHTYSVWLPHYLYKKEGYIEVQEDKTNYYVWIDRCTVPEKK